MERPAVRTYAIGFNEETKEEKITCFICNKTSYHPKDIKEKYCNYCRHYHDDIADEIYSSFIEQEGRRPISRFDKIYMMELIEKYKKDHQK